MGESYEQQARDMMERAGWVDAQQYTACDVVELANLIAANERQSAEIERLTTNHFPKGEFMSNQLELTLSTASELSHGAVGVAVDRLIKQAVRDCIDRPADKRPRTVTLGLFITPTPRVEGQSVTCEGAPGVAKAKLKIPDYETSEIDFGVRNNGSAIFAPHSPENHTQASFLDDDEE